MTKDTGSFVLHMPTGVIRETTEHLFRQPDVDEALKAATCEEWSEVKASLPEDSPHLQLASDFFDACESLNAFAKAPGCAIDLLDDGGIMFDWNNGERPIFTVVITPENRVIDVGRFDDGKVTGDAKTLSLAKMHLRQFARENGLDTWPMQHTMRETFYSLGPSLKEKEPSPAQAREPGFTHHHPERIFQCSLKEPGKTWLELVVTPGNAPARTGFMDGPLWPTVHSGRSISK